MLAHGSHASIIKVGREFGKEYICFGLSEPTDQPTRFGRTHIIISLFIEFYFANHRVTVRHIAKDGKDGRLQKKTKKERRQARQ